MAESKAPSVQGLSADVRHARRLWRRSKPVLALPEERVPAHASLHANLVSLSGDERHLDQRGLLELLDHRVLGHRVPRLGVGRVGLALAEFLGVPRQLIPPRAARWLNRPLEYRLVDA